MTIILVLCILGAAAWLVLSVTAGLTRRPKESVDGFSRALAAIQPEPVRRPPARRPSARHRTRTR